MFKIKIEGFKDKLKKVLEQLEDSAEAAHPGFGF
jgi:hypothetical protein